jgi:hypothetical protein
MVNTKIPQSKLHSPRPPSPLTCKTNSHTLKVEFQSPPDIPPTPIPSPPSPRYPPSYPKCLNPHLGIRYQDLVHLVYLAGFGLCCLTSAPSSPNTLTNTFLTLLYTLQNPKQSNYLSLHNIYHIFHIPSPLTYICKKLRFLSMNQCEIHVCSSQIPRTPPIHDKLNSFLSYLSHNITIPFITLYIHTFLLLTRYLPHNPSLHPSPYLYTNTYPDHLSLSLIIQNISLAFLLPQCGDIELNPGPCSHIIPNLPLDYKSRRSIYFLPKTIKFKPEYQHLAQNFAPHLISTHPLHSQKTLFHPHLFQFIHTHSSHPSPRLLYTLIVTLSPSPDTCELTFHHSPNPPHAQTLLTCLSQLPTPPEIQITTLYPFDLFQQANAILIHPPNTIHIQLYDFIHQHPNPPHFLTLQNKFPFLPTSVLVQVL